MKSRHKLVVGLVCLIAVGTVLGHDSAKPSGNAPAKAQAVTHVVAATASKQIAVEARGDTPEPPGESPRMVAEASRDLFAGKSWYVAPPPSPPPKPTAPPFPYVYSGSMRGKGANDDVILFLAQNARIVIVRTGETVGGSYRLDGITESEAIFTYLPLQEKQSLSIGNNP